MNSKLTFAFLFAFNFAMTPAFAGMVDNSNAGRTGSSSNGDFNRGGGMTGSTVSSPGLNSGTGIQTPANDAGNKQQMGTMISSIALGIGVAGTAATCSPPPKGACPYFVAGTAVSAIALVGMSMAQSKSKASKAAVSSGAYGGNYEQDAMNMLQKDPNYQEFQRAKPKLDKLGYKIDEKKGTWYDPNKKKWFTPNDFKDASSMTKAGLSKTEQQGFSSTMDQMKKDTNAQAKAKGIGADSSLNADDLTVGGKGGAGGGATAGNGSETGNGNPAHPDAGLAINRDPAQVAGMAKAYNGEMIGVAGDSLFDMMDRRYNLHQNKGNFLDASGEASSPGIQPNIGSPSAGR